jgi:hypothetical protein
MEEIAKPLTVEEAERAEGGEDEAGPDEVIRRRAEEAERRHRARRERERAGFRRYRPGPGTASFSPFFCHPAEQSSRGAAPMGDAVPAGGRR